MQKRFGIASADTFQEASEVKAKLLEEFPERRFQIRRSRKEFRIVERVAVSDAVEKQGVSKRGKKRGRFV